jgi:hypothetical protein
MVLVIQEKRGGKDGGTEEEGNRWHYIRGQKERMQRTCLQEARCWYRMGSKPAVFFHAV